MVLFRVKFATSLPNLFDNVNNDQINIFYVFGNFSSFCYGLSRFVLALLDLWTGAPQL